MKFRYKVYRDLRHLIFGLGLTFVVLSLLAAWRQFEVNTFLFTQLVMICFFIYLILLISSGKFSRVFSGRELISVIIAFTVASSLTLNIDRSRSFSSLKWVYELQTSGPVEVSDLREFKKLSSEDFKAVNQRIEEQIQLGFLREGTEGVVLTKRGEAIIWIAKLVARFCNLTGFNKM